MSSADSGLLNPVWKEETFTKMSILLNVGRDSTSILSQSNREQLRNLQERCEDRKKNLIGDKMAFLGADQIAPEQDASQPGL